MRPLINQVFSWLLPSRCVICSAPRTEQAGNESGLCPACHASLPALQKCCPICGRPLAASNPPACGQCQQDPPAFDHTLVPYAYQQPIDKLITGLKFNARLAHAEVLAKLFVDTLGDTPRPELLIPMPLHRRRLRQRGFNQSLEIARVISRNTGIPVDAEACARIRDTAPQSSLPARQRRGNVKNAFLISQPLNVRHVAIVDDVMTSGHTANELARALKNTGVKIVDIWVMARTVKK